jgi:hypothetical protein
VRIGRPSVLVAVIVGVAGLLAVEWPGLWAGEASCRVFGRIATQDGRPLVGVALELSTGAVTRPTGADGRFVLYLTGATEPCTIRPVLFGYGFVPAQRTIQPSGSDVQADFTGVRCDLGASMGRLGQLPDLVISRLRVTPSPSDLGTELTATVQGKNIGARRTRATFHVAFWKHRPTRPNGTHYDTRWTITGLKAGARTPLLTYSFTPSVARSYKAWAMIDSSSKVREAREDNNLVWRRYTVQGGAGHGRDLTVSSLTIIPDPSQLGSELTATVIGENAGTVDVAGTIGLSFWQNRTTAPTDRTGEDQYWSVPSLPAGATTDVLTYEFTPTAPGSYQGWAFIDSTKVWDESDETNNTTSCAYTVSNLPPKPELSVYDFAIEPDPCGIGSSVNVRVKVINTSTAAAGAFQVGFWKDRNTPPPSGTGADHYWSVSGLGGGEVTSWLTWSFLATQGGQFQGWAFADCRNEVMEANEGNNKLPANWRVIGPDLIVSHLDVMPESSSLGTALTATIKVKNTGTQDICPLVIATLGFWETLAAAPVDCTGADKTWEFPGLAVGEEAGPFTFGFAPRAAGSYTAWAYADCSNVVTELNEANNVESFDYSVN